MNAKRVLFVLWFGLLLSGRFGPTAHAKSVDPAIRSKPFEFTGEWRVSGRVADGASSQTNGATSGQTSGTDPSKTTTNTTGTDSAAPTGGAWVLVNTHWYPFSDNLNKPPYTAKYEDRSIELKRRGQDEHLLHVRYSWTEPPRVIQPGAVVTVRLHQEALGRSNVHYSGFSVSMKIGEDGLDLDKEKSGTAQGKYPDGSAVKSLVFGYRGDPQCQGTTHVDWSIPFFGKEKMGERRAIYIMCHGQADMLGVRYTYEWRTDGAAPTPPAPKADIVGLWHFEQRPQPPPNKTSYPGRLEFTRQGAGWTGRVYFDTYSKWENLSDVRFNPETGDIRFSRPPVSFNLLGKAQAHTGKVSGSEIKGKYDNGHEWTARRLPAETR